MRYVQGSDLRTLVQREGPLAPERALAILGQIAGALDAAHRQGLVHRDVKPANVLLDEDEHAYLTDFGITKQLGDDTSEAGQAAGTLDYLAPEQIRGEAVDGRTDGYALACVLYECLAGAPPFRRQTEAETLWAHLREEPPPLETHPALDPVLRRGLAHEKDERYPSCAALIDAARDVVVPGRAGASSPRADGRRARARRRCAHGRAAPAQCPGEEGAAAKAPAGNGIVAIGPESEQFAAFVATAAAPSNIAVGEGAVWFLNAVDDNISRIDPETKAVTDRDPEPWRVDRPRRGRGCVVARHRRRRGGNWTKAVHRIDPRTGDITNTARLPRGQRGRSPYVNGGFPQIAVGSGGVWATGGGWVARLDPRTGRRVATIEADAHRIAAGREGVWFVGPYQAGAVTAIDPGTNRTLKPIDVGDANLTGIAVGGGSVWVTAENEGFVWRITPGASTATPIDVGSGVNYVAYGAGAVWVASYIDGTLSRIDPRTNRVVAQTPIGAAQALAAGAGSAWVATAGATRAGTLPVSACEAVPGGARPDVVIASISRCRASTRPRGRWPTRSAPCSPTTSSAPGVLRRVQLVRRLDAGRQRRSTYAAVPRTRARTRTPTASWR